jgi:hypothetical protein
MDAFELSPQCHPETYLSRHPELEKKPIIRGSDAHTPAQIGTAWTDLLIDRPALSEIALAFDGRNGRIIYGMS